LLLSQVGYLCNNAHIEDGSLFGQPTEGALIAVAQKVQLKVFKSWEQLLPPAICVGV